MTILNPIQRFRNGRVFQLTYLAILCLITVIFTILLLLISSLEPLYWLIGFAIVDMMALIGIPHFIREVSVVEESIFLRRDFLLSRRISINSINSFSINSGFRLLNFSSKVKNWELALKIAGDDLRFPIRGTDREIKHLFKLLARCGIHPIESEIMTLS